MLIYESKKSRSIQKVRVFSLLGLLLFFCMLTGFWYWSDSMGRTIGIFCNAETIVESEKGQKILFKNNRHLFYNGQTRSDEKARSGKYSSLVNDQQKYGIRYDLLNPEPGKFYEASVWRFQSGTREGMLVASDPSGQLLYKTTKIPIIENEDGWDKLALKFLTPFHINVEAIRIYVFASGDGKVFFDDFQLREIPFEADSAFQIADVRRINIRLDDVGTRKLENKRNEALNKGILKTENDDWVNGHLDDRADQQLDIRMRLKGDFLDHLKDNKWSFRIKVKDPESWYGLKTFSVQHPATREYLNEWFFHQVLEKEEILSTAYDFATVSLNNKELGIYAWEEHFEKQLVESRNLREGPIIRFSEAAYFDGIGHDLAVFGEDLNKGNRNETESAEILPFTENKVKASETLQAQFIAAASLLQEFKFNTKAPTEIFDLDKMAKFFAIVDMTGAYHAIIWHNLRFYFNPVLGHLEPVAFDGFGIGLTKWKNRPFFGYGVFHPEYDGLEMYKNLFLDKEFMRKYIYYLNAFTERTYVDEVLVNLEKGLQSREQILRKEFPDYTFNRKAIENNAGVISELLRPVHTSALIVHSMAPDEDSLKISVTNNWFLPFELLGTGRFESRMDFSFPENLWINADKEWTVPEALVLNAPKDARYIFYKIPGLKEIYVAAINQIDPGSQHLKNSIDQIASNLISNDLFHFENNTVTFKVGQHQLSESLIIPKGNAVSFPAGCEIDLIRGAAIVSYSPVILSGTEERPVIIRSSDGKNGGFSVFSVQERSKINFTIFENLDAFSDNGKTTLGAVNFYESNVDITHSSFTANNCEDGLNIIRSEFSLVNSTISNTFSDGFDADFCKGLISNTRFINTGNDGLDLSGSVVTIEQCYIDKTGDKGISVGERSSVIIKSATILNSPVGVASKDLSKTIIEQIDLENCTTGFSAYRKKPEFGGATIEVIQYNAENVKSLFLVEPGSEIKMPG
ncbi:MAG: right-handed parallel beta-helix repeat-containing protein [Bacteroidota bacterium]